MNSCKRITFAWCFFSSMHLFRTYSAYDQINESYFYKHASKVSKRGLYVEDSEIILEINGSNRWFTYLEENDHSLFGSATPIFIAKRNKSKNSSLIEYYQKPFIISDAQNIELLVRKRDVQTEKPKISISHDKKYSNLRTFNLSHSWFTDGHQELNNNLISSLSYLEKNPTVKNNDTSKKKKRSISKKDTDVVYIKILVVIDYDTFVLHNRDLVLTATYISALLNGVDLRFRQMKNPKVRLNLAGIIIPEVSSAAPYLEWYQNGHQNKLAKMIIIDMKSHFSGVFKNRKYDIVLSIVKLPLVFDSWPTKGKSFRPYDWPKQPALAIVPDNGGLSSTQIITTVIAFVLGANLDGETSRCSVNDGYIMSDNNYYVGKNKFLFSNCSIETMQIFLGNDSIKENFNKKPNVGKPFAKKLPGRVFNRNEQCKRINRIYKSDMDREYNCLELNCKLCDNIFSWDILCNKFKSAFYPAEGSSCGVGKICLNGTCIHESEITNWKLDHLS